MKKTLILLCVIVAGCGTVPTVETIQESKAPDNIKEIAADKSIPVEERMAAGASFIAPDSISVTGISHRTVTKTTVRRVIPSIISSAGAAEVPPVVEETTTEVVEEPVDMRTGVEKSFDYMNDLLKLVGVIIATLVAWKGYGRIKDRNVA